MSDVKPISRRELLAYRADIKNEIFRQIRAMFHRLQITQKELAAKLSMDEASLSRRLRGANDMRLESFSDLARGLDCRIDVRLTPLKDVVAINKNPVYTMSRGGDVIMFDRRDGAPAAQLNPSKPTIDSPYNKITVAA